MGFIAMGVWRSARNLGGWQRAVDRLPTVRAGELREGQRAKLVGIVEAAETIVAPLTGRPCVAWTVRAIGLGAEPAAVGRARRSAAGDFIVRDADGGRVIVRGERAQVVLVDGAPISAARVAGAVQRESILVQGDAVIVVGMVRRELDPGGEAMYREAPTRLVLDGIPLWILPAKAIAPSGRR